MRWTSPNANEAAEPVTAPIAGRIERAPGTSTGFGCTTRRRRSARAEGSYTGLLQSPRRKLAGPLLSEPTTEVERSRPSRIAQSGWATCAQPGAMPVPSMRTQQDLSTPVEGSEKAGVRHDHLMLGYPGNLLSWPVVDRWWMNGNVKIGKHFYPFIVRK
jgi:hypothetical protein